MPLISVAAQIENLVQAAEQRGMTPMYRQHQHLRRRNDQEIEALHECLIRLREIELQHTLWCIKNHIEEIKATGRYPTRLLMSQALRDFIFDGIKRTGMLVFDATRMREGEYMFTLPVAVIDEMSDDTVIAMATGDQWECRVRF